MTRLAVDQCGGKNVAAFLDMIAHAEGVARFSEDDGYDVVVGGSLFKSYADHPRITVTLANLGIRSSAAGRYQFLIPTWDGLRALLGKSELPDFSPVSQDRACIELLRQNGAYSYVRDGRLYEAINAARRTWASLPGAGYGQRELTAESLRVVYVNAGGVMRTAA